MATLINAVMATWAPDTRHYVTNGGRHVAVHVHAELNDRTKEIIAETFPGTYTVNASPTTVTECTEDGAAVSLTPLRVFPPGTSHEDALTQLEQE